MVNDIFPSAKTFVCKTTVLHLVTIIENFNSNDLFNIGLPIEDIELYDDEELQSTIFLAKRTDLPANDSNKIDIGHITFISLSDEEIIFSISIIYNSEYSLIYIQELCSYIEQIYDNRIRVINDCESNDYIALNKKVETTRQEDNKIIPKDDRILELYLMGKKVKDICNILEKEGYLDTAEKTIRNHLSAIRRKIGEENLPYRKPPKRGKTPG